MYIGRRMYHRRALLLPFGTSFFHGSLKYTIVACAMLPRALEG